MRKYSYNRFASWAFVIFIVCLTLTLLQGYFVIFRRQWIFLGGISVIGLFVASSYISKGHIFWLVLYFLIITVNVFFGDHFWGTTGQNLFELFLLLAPAIMTYYAFSKQDLNFMKAVLLVFFLIVVFEAVASYIVDLQFPEIIRTLNGRRESGGDDSAWFFYRLGVANYDIGHALPAVIPLLILGVKELSRFPRMIMLILLLITSVFIFISYSTMALILGVFVAILSLLSRKGSLMDNKVLIFISIIILPLLLNDSFSLGILDFIDGFVNQNSSLHSKIIAIHDSILYGDSEGDVYAREQNYQKTLDAIRTNFLFGTDAKVGGHSSLLDRLATLGLIGFIPYLVFLYRQIMYGMSQIQKEYRIYYVEAISVCLLMLLSKDSDTWELFFTMFTIVPFMTFLLSSQNEYK